MAGLTGLTSISSYFPADTVAGQTGAGSKESQGTALQRQQLNIPAKNRNIYRPFDAETEPAPFFDYEDSYDLPGSMNPDQTPRTHAIPFAGWAPSYESPELAELNENIMEIHSQDFGALNPRVHSAKFAIAESPIDIWYDTSAGEVNLQPLSGQVRQAAGYDAVQGYGGGGSGPGGINPDSPGHGKRTTFTEPQPTYSLDPAERPFRIPQGGVNAVFTDEVQGPGTYQWSYGDAAATHREPTAYEPVSAPAPFDAAGYTEGPII